MTSFDMLSPLARAAFALWALLLCLAYICLAALAAVRKRRAFAAFAAVLLSAVYFMWQVIFDISLSQRTNGATAVSRALGSLPFAAWLAALNVRYDKNYITPAAIKSFLDGIPCGVCCFRDSGRVIFSNVCMNGLCAELTGAPPMDGNALRDAVSGGLVTSRGKVWRFTCRDIVSDGETLHELIASDVTAEYAKTEALEADKAALSELNLKLREYYLNIDDAVRRGEILRAKVNIHDEMNRLMLSTTAADRGDGAQLDRIFSMWEKNALLLCMEARGEDSGVDALAEALKINLVWRADLPATLSDAQKCLFFTAAKEAAVNAVKHASAKELEISFEETDGALAARFVNGGNVPAGEVRFTGGLANLERLAKKQGASVTARGGEKVTLTLAFSRKHPHG